MTTLHSAEDSLEDLGQFTIQCSLFWALSCRTRASLPRTCAHQPYHLQRTLCPVPTSPKDRGAEVLHLLPTYQNWFYREADFYFIYLLLKRELMKSTRTDTAFLSASWTSLTRKQNEISQHSKGLSDEKLIPKPTGKGKRLERFRSDLLLDLERRCWSPGSAALLCL